MKKIKLRKWVIVLFLLVLILVFASLGFYGYAMQSVSHESENVSFVVQNGASKITIAENLKEAGLIRSKYALLLYLFFNSDLNLQAGTYELDRSMTPTEMIEKIHNGDIKIETISFTFVEGKNVNDLIKIIATKFNYSEEEVKEVLKSPDFTKRMIEKYDFLTDTILNGNIYYALEGYLYPDTYEILESASIEDILEKMLDNTQLKLSTLDLTSSEYSIHEILTMASIVELEGANESDRAKFAQVIYKRLELGMTLGMDTTTYYAVQKSRSEGLTRNDLNIINPYNTRTTDSSMAGKLPIGPIGNPSVGAIEAVLNPSDTDYVYFVANTCTGETFFTVEYMDHLNKTRELKSICATN